ncbi:hypothetical protein IW261DRAFT_421125 [Armillaria novae-zelandiae]|uniref:Uncharacterized protein n=1 Tax=Armillaria novae-zelandiae TaxID=153914 RepID=A0AA39P2P7_9AGAR|nr:hypothetical protein IW261DRAFT_421125 [Armillaria novae-zelandiae]
MALWKLCLRRLSRRLHSRIMEKALVNCRMRFTSGVPLCWTYKRLVHRYSPLFVILVFGNGLGPRYISFIVETIFWSTRVLVSAVTSIFGLLGVTKGSTNFSFHNNSEFDLSLR